MRITRDQLTNQDLPVGLAFSVNFLLSLLSSVTDYLLVWDSSARLVYVNRDMEGVLPLVGGSSRGVTREEVEMSRLFEERRADVLRDGQPRSGELLWSQEGREQATWFEYQLCAVDDPPGTRVALCVARDMTWRKDESRRVERAEVQVKALFERLVSVQEEERRRIARDLHDQLGQQLTALRMNLEVFRLQSAGDSSTLQQLERTQRLADDLDRSIDFLTWQLRPEPLEHLGLAAALQQLVRQWSERFGIESHFAGVGEELPRLPPDVEVNLYRIAQEALHNVVKHASATEVNVMIQIRTGGVTLAVEDNGDGFVYSPDHRSADQLGLVSMRERAQLVGGEFTVDSEIGDGTRIVVRVPSERA